MAGIDSGKKGPEGAKDFRFEVNTAYGHEEEGSQKKEKSASGPREIGIVEKWKRGKPAPPDLKAMKYTATFVGNNKSDSPQFEGVPFAITLDQIPGATFEARKSSVRSKSAPDVNYNYEIPFDALKKGDVVEFVRLEADGAAWGPGRGIVQSRNIRTRREEDIETWAHVKRSQQEEIDKIIEKM